MCYIVVTAVIGPSCQNTERLVESNMLYGLILGDLIPMRQQRTTGLVLLSITSELEFRITFS